ncbi:MAG: hypothetical protein J5649_07110 [Lachnospiraceae bacterium]|nr:hypothetical protein [Lachnospiraceae bacterium]
MAQRSTGQSKRSSSSSGRSGSRSNTRSVSRSNTRGSGSGSTRGTRSGGSRGGNGGDSGMMILLKATLFVLAIALVFGLASWGLEKLQEKGDKNETVTTTPAGGKNPTGGQNQNPDEPTDTPTPVPTQSPEDFAKSVLESVSSSKLGLDKKLSEYDVQCDDYVSNFNGKDYVGAIVLDRSSGGLVASFYVALDRSEILSEREDGEFDVIKP